MDAEWRIVGVEDPDFPVFYRIIARRHVQEMSMLSSSERTQCTALLHAIEKVLIWKEQPTSINLASFGNVVPHLHWHVVARFEWDSHFPEPVWGRRQRELAVPPIRRLRHSIAQLDEAVRLAAENL